MSHAWLGVLRFLTLGDVVLVSSRLLLCKRRHLLSAVLARSGSWVINKTSLLCRLLRFLAFGALAFMAFAIIPGSG